MQSPVTFSAAECQRSIPAISWPLDNFPDKFKHHTIMSTTYSRDGARQLIDNANSSGQGNCPLHLNHPLLPVITEMGYQYSHTTPVGTLTGDGFTLHHTFAFPGKEHKVSVIEGSRLWDTCTSCGSGRKWSGFGLAELTAHLKSKRRRYDLK